MLILRIRRGEPARPSYLCDDVRPTRDNPFSKNTLPNIPLTSHTPFGRAGHAPTLLSYDTIGFVSGNQFTSCNENNRENSPSALVGASLLARQTSATMFARHTTIHSKKHITNHSIIFAHPVRAGVRRIYPISRRFARLLGDS